MCQRSNPLHGSRIHLRDVLTSFTPKSLPHNPFADPHPLNPVTSILYKNSGGQGYPLHSLSPRSFSYVVTSLRPSFLFSKSFRCNTYGPPRKCCKQKTYGEAKSCRCNTYRKQGYLLQAKCFSLSSPRGLCLSLPPILRTLFQVPYPVSPLRATLTKTPGVWGYSSHFGTERGWS